VQKKTVKSGGVRFNSFGRLPLAHVS